MVTTMATAAADSTSTEGPVKKRRKLSRRPAKWIQGTGRTLRRTAHDHDAFKAFDKTTLVDKLSKVAKERSEDWLLDERRARQRRNFSEEDELPVPAYCLKELFEEHLIKEDRGSLVDAEQERTDLPTGVLRREGDSEPYIFNEEDDA